MNYPTELVREIQPIPEEVDQADLNAKGLFVVQGLTVALAAQLMDRSFEPHVLDFCRGDSEGRFNNLQSIIDWQKKQRLSLPLVSSPHSDDPRLEGMGWLGPQAPDSEEPQFASATITYAERLYEDAAGDGNGSPYARVMLDTHEALGGNNKNVWLEATANNKKAINSYLRAGFNIYATGYKKLNGKMTKRVYMTLDEVADPITEY